LSRTENGSEGNAWTLRHHVFGNGRHGVGALLFISGDAMTGGALFLVGAAVHFGMGGFATGF